MLFLAVAVSTDGLLASQTAGSGILWLSYHNKNNQNSHSQMMESWFLRISRARTLISLLFSQVISVSRSKIKWECLIMALMDL